MISGFQDIVIKARLEDRMIDRVKDSVITISVDKLTRRSKYRLIARRLDPPGD